VLHQLRYVLGDSLFFAGMHAYATDTVNFKYHSSTIGDYRDKMAEVSGQNLDWFFNEWVFQPNHPVYRNLYTFEQVPDDRWKVNFTARQTTQAGLIYFQMPLELKISFLDGTDTIVRAFNSFNGEELSFFFMKQPSNLIFDPNNEIVLKEGTTMVGIDELSETSAESKLLNISPNPFHESTMLSYKISHAGKVSIIIYDSYGKKVRELVSASQKTGSYKVRFDAAGLSPGLYQCHFINGSTTETIKLLLQ
jgi:hypothetical protein